MFSKEYSIFKKNYLAFLHIKKNAGTTLAHILRTNFFLRYCSLQLLCRNLKDGFKAEDMKKVLLINPMIKCISGHYIRPRIDLHQKYPNLKYITLLRDPLKRYISQYQHNVEKLRHQVSFDDFLNSKSSYNKQTRTIAGSDNVELAKEILNKNFLLVGTVEEFDGFLLLLKNKLRPLNLKIDYRSKNIAKMNSTAKHDIDKKINYYYEKIVDRNKVDFELYQYVKNKILPKEKEEYGKNYENDLREFKLMKKGFNRNFLSYIDYAIRKIYYEPIFKIIIRRNRIG